MQRRIYTEDESLFYIYIYIDTYIISLEYLEKFAGL